ncbi:MAG TPA: NAD(P)H-quinone oxidoreductase, partial [Cytophagales bacterium]|nr:NAD(P)H-quinone oxidoreductase [Cytophagales bacterium]
GAPADIPGLEVAGVVVAVGEGTERWQIGDRVCALVAGGGYGELVAAPGVQCLPIPDGLSFTEAASLPETYFTVWTNIFDRGQFTSGEKVLIHGGTSGIGVAGIQIIAAMGGTVYVTAGSDEKCAYAERLGAAKAINYRTHDFEKEVKSLAPDGVNLILDMVGGEYARKNVDLLAVEGRIVIINAMQGRIGEVDLMKVMVKRLVITGSTLRARDSAFKHDIALSLEKRVWPLFAEGKVKPIIHATFPMEQAAQAHEMIEAGGHIGKIMLVRD